MRLWVIAATLSLVPGVAWLAGCALSTDGRSVAAVQQESGADDSPAAPRSASSFDVAATLSDFLRNGPPVRTDESPTLVSREKDERTTERTSDLLSLQFLTARKAGFDRVPGTTRLIRNPDDEMSIRSISVALFPEPASNDESSMMSRVRWVTTQDRELISRFVTGFRRSSVRTPRIAPRIPLKEAFGVIELALPGERIRVLMAETFVMPIDGEFTENGAFVSARLAAAVGELLKRKSSLALSSEQTDGLIGLTALRREQQAYAEDEFGSKDLRRRQEPAEREAPDFSTYTPFDFPTFNDCEAAEWGKLEFLAKHPIEGMRVRLGDLPYDDAWFDKTITDEITLRRAQRGLRETWKGSPFRGVYFGMLANVEITFYAGGRSVPIYVNCSFHILNGCETDHGFQSWTLAKVLNEIIIRHTGEGVSRQDFEYLAGRLAVKGPGNAQQAP